MFQRAAVAIVACLLAACADGEQELVWEDPPELPRPTVNDCAEPAFPFDAVILGQSRRGGSLVNFDVGGFSYYEYTTSPDTVTTVYMQPCDPDVTDDRLVIAYYSLDRLPVGTHEVVPDAELRGGVTFGYSDLTPGEEIACNHQQSGTVEVATSTFERIEGSYDVYAWCITRAEPRRPLVTHFKGSFSSLNVGVE